MTLGEFLKELGLDDFILFGGLDGNYQELTKEQLLKNLDGVVIEIDDGHIYHEEIGFYIDENFYTVGLM